MKWRLDLNFEALLQISDDVFDDITVLLHNDHEWAISWVQNIFAIAGTLETTRFTKYERQTNLPKNEVSYLLVSSNLSDSTSLTMYLMTSPSCSMMITNGPLAGYKTFSLLLVPLRLQELQNMKFKFNYQIFTVPSGFRSGQSWWSDSGNNQQTSDLHHFDLSMEMILKLCMEPLLYQFFQFMFLILHCKSSKIMKKNFFF